VIGFAGVYFVLVFLNIGGIGQLLTNIAGFLIPGYYSIVALKTVNKNDDTQLLTYWVVFAFLSVIEFWSSAILYWVPFYFLFKLVFLLYIGTPATGGAQLVYDHLVGPVSDMLIDTAAKKLD
jgi:receptor expression-enhancing protein 5/6